jgi:hypothetical protein
MYNFAPANIALALCAAPAAAKLGSRKYVELRLEREQLPSILNGTVFS